MNEIVGAQPRSQNFFAFWYEKKARKKSWYTLNLIGLSPRALYQKSEKNQNIFTFTNFQLQLTLSNSNSRDSNLSLIRINSESPSKFLEKLS